MIDHPFYFDTENTKQIDEKQWLYFPLVRIPFKSKREWNNNQSMSNLQEKKTKKEEEEEEEEQKDLKMITKKNKNKDNTTRKTVIYFIYSVILLNLLKSTFSWYNIYDLNMSVKTNNLPSLNMDYCFEIPLVL